MDMEEMCSDNRFELIEKYKNLLIAGTNIGTNPSEMEVLDSILFRIWQVGWLDRLEDAEELYREAYDEGWHYGAEYANFCSPQPQE